MRAGTDRCVLPVALLCLCLTAGCSPAARGPVAPGEGDTPPPSSGAPNLKLARRAKVNSAAESPVLGYLRSELARNFAALAGDDLPPYYIGYQAVDRRVVTVVSSFGALVDASSTAVRVLDADVRVGSARLDNTRQLRGEWDTSREFMRSAFLPLSDDEAALRAVAWLTTHAEHQRAREDLGRVLANRQVQVGEEDDAGDFWAAAPVTHHEAPAVLEAEPAAWAERVRRWSSPFLAHGDLLTGTAALTVEAETRYFTNSEGSSVQVARPHARIEIAASTTAPDGMRLARVETEDRRGVDSLPTDEEVMAITERVVQDLLALRKAPVVEPFQGPAILDGRAAAVFFHEIFGHRTEGHRQKDDAEGQTFAHLVGEPVMPSFLDVFDDPTVETLNGVPLNGHYLFDDEGVPGQLASLAAGGRLTGFLLSRSPVQAFTASNGHGRRDRGRRAVARQANLVVSPARTVTRDGLKGMLLAEMRRQKKPFGLRFTEITGGFTNTSRYGAQAFKVLPVMVYRVSPDGHEELVRGVDLEGTPLAALARIEAAADDFQVFNGLCGAESGWVPVSATSPSILVSQIEVTRQESSHDLPPLVPPPRASSTSKPVVTP